MADFNASTLDSAGSSVFILKPLSAQSFRGQLEVVPGKVYTLGRSNSCDLIFHDGRISRRHCQLVVDPDDSSLVLFHGIDTETFLEGTQAIRRIVAQMRKRSDCRVEDPATTTPEAVKIPQHYSPSKLCPLQFVKASSVYLNGEEVPFGTSKVVTPGSEVSLVVPKRSSPSVGFSVEESRYRRMCPDIAPGNAFSDGKKDSEIRESLEKKKKAAESDSQSTKEVKMSHISVSCLQQKCSLQKVNSWSAESRNTARRCHLKELNMNCHDQTRSRGTVNGYAFPACEGHVKRLKVSSQLIGSAERVIQESIKLRGEFSASKEVNWNDRPATGTNGVKSENNKSGCDNNSRHAGAFISSIQAAKTPLPQEGEIVQGKQYNDGMACHENNFDAKCKMSSHSICDRESKLEGQSDNSLGVSGVEELKIVDKPVSTEADSDDIIVKDSCEEKNNCDPVNGTETFRNCIEWQQQKVSNQEVDILSKCDTATEQLGKKKQEKKHERHLPTGTKELLVSVSETERVPPYSPESSGLCLNKLEGVEQMKSHVSLQELLSPIEDLQEIFIATFTSDILWFLSSANLPRELPVTVACHHQERCWSTSVDDRVESPYPQWPRVKIVYPAFPVLRRTKDKVRMRGIGCHHPKLFLLKRTNSIRVIVTSANLTYRQWLQVSNTVWWQDFPQQHVNDYRTLFRLSGAHASPPDSKVTTGDFAAQLAAFVSSMLKDVPTEAHCDLAKYDFSSAAVSLVASIPGLHAPPLPFPSIQRSGFSSKASSSIPEKYLGTVSTTVVGISHWFHSRADPNGARLRKLAALLNNITADSEGMIPVLLKRVRDLPADPNAVAISVFSKPDSTGLLQGTGFNVEKSGNSHSEQIQLGFLPRPTAQWIAPLCDGGICSFTARLLPKQALAVAAGQSKSAVRLALYAFEGPQFSQLPSKFLNAEQVSALSTLLSSVQRNYGIWRLQEVLSQCKWPDSAETDFVYCASSIGTSLNSGFLASFSAATGRKAISDDESYESDPEWGCWTAQHEQASPSIKVLFPTVEQIKDAKWGPSSYRGLLCFAERTWERLKSTGLLHDAIPYPAIRAGVPMHIKVARRRFQLGSSEAAFGWIYSGSHNFSPAAWGKCLNISGNQDAFDVQTRSRLHICNYELGIIFMEPSTVCSDDGDSKLAKMQAPKRQGGLDDFLLPFMVPPPKYSISDRPANGYAIYKLLQELGEQRGETSILNEAGEAESEISSEIEIDGQDSEDDVSSTTSGSYVEALWNQTTSKVPHVH